MSPPPPTITLIEDDDMNRRILAYLLQKHGYTVLAAASYAELDAEIAQSALTISDVGALSNGELQSLSQRKLILISGSVDGLSRAQRFAPDASYLEKPFPIETLLPILTERLED